MNITFSKHKKGRIQKKRHAPIKGALYRKENPDRVWAALFLAFLILLAVSVAYHIYLFSYVESGKGEVVAPEEEGTTVRIREEKLESLLQMFDERAATTERIKTTPASFDDPSL